MGKGCLTVSKYFLFLFNLIFFLFGVTIMGFGLWLLLDNQSFIVFLNNFPSVKAGCYILIAVGAFATLMGFVGCIGAIYEIRCLLGLYFTCILLILLAQIAAGALIYFKKDELNTEMSKIVVKVLEDYSGNESSTETAWDHIQQKMKCCGWNNSADWNTNTVIQNSSGVLYPCSCHDASLDPDKQHESGFCEAPTTSWPVYLAGCSESVENWIVTNMAVVLGICVAVAFIELLGMVLSVCMCRNIQTEDYTKVPRY
uniref:Tetraspanin n=1 Tax=Fundulus heteroclitus TaxID=8078 RepID=A0A3Q2QY20_FUNHE